jgi:hypothetical protein
MGGLIGIGQQYAGRAQQGIGQAAGLQRGRAQFNQQIKDAERAQMGGMAGTGAGLGLVAGGPVGAAIGAGIGLLASSIF